jgi:hypothetical protein
MISVNSQDICDGAELRRDRHIAHFAGEGVAAKPSSFAGHLCIDVEASPFSFAVQAEAC